MRYPVKLAEEAGGVHETLKLPGSCGSCSAVRSVGLTAAVHKKNNACDSHNSSAAALHHLICIKLRNAATHLTFFCSQRRLVFSLYSEKIGSHLNFQKRV